jgi:hypothetical protein
MGLRPAQGDENQLPFSNYCRWKRRPPLCHLDRSAAEWRDLRFNGSPLEMFFDRAHPDFLLRAASDDHLCGSPQREPQPDHQSHGSRQRIYASDGTGTLGKS